MVDEPLYDPDRTVPEDLDLSDPAVARAYLDHPTTEALIADLGREFQQLPAAARQQQIRASLEATRDQIIVDVKDLEPDASARQILSAVDGQIDAMKRRIAELD